MTREFNSIEEQMAAKAFEIGMTREQAEAYAARMTFATFVATVEPVPDGYGTYQVRWGRTPEMQAYFIEQDGAPERDQVFVKRASLEATLNSPYFPA